MLVVPFSAFVVGLISFSVTHQPQSLSWTERVVSNRSQGNPGDELVSLAEKRFESLSDTNRRLLRAVARGEIADFRESSQGPIDLGTADRWPASRVISARVVKWLCTDLDASKRVTHAGINIIGARVDGNLILHSATIAFPLRFDNCAFTGVIHLRGAETRGLSFEGSQTGSIDATGWHVQGDVYMNRGFRAQGEVHLHRATIRGNLDCSTGQLSNPGKVALHADEIKVEGSMNLSNGFKSEGETRLRNASIERALICQKGQFINRPGRAIDAEGMKVEHGVYMQDIRAEGSLRLASVTIGGSLECARAQIRCEQEDTPAFDGEGLKVTGNLIMSDDFKSIGEVRLRNATIQQVLSCDGAKLTQLTGVAFAAESLKLERSLLFREAIVDGEVRIQNAVIAGNLEFDGTQIIVQRDDPTALRADLVSVSGNVHLRNKFKAVGMVRFIGASVTGELDCSGGQIINPNSDSLSARTISVGGSVFLRHSFSSEGMVRLTGATIGGDLNCDQAKFVNKWERPKAIEADRMKVSGSVLMRNGFKAKGEVVLRSSSIGGNLAADDGKFVNVNGAEALSAEAIKVDGDVFLNSKSKDSPQFKVKGRVSLVNATIAGHLHWYNVLNPDRSSLDLRSATAGTLHDHESSWPKPGNLFLAGLAYKALDDDDLTPKDALPRQRWLRLQVGSPYSPQPYVQLAGVLRNMGHEDDARLILEAKEVHRAELPISSKTLQIWYYWIGPIIGYGYRPFRALYPAAATILLGWLFFWLGYRHKIMEPTANDAWDSPGTRKLRAHYPKFCSLVYSLDVFAPLIGLYQESYWHPNVDAGPPWFGRHVVSHLLRWWLWVQKIAGWFLTSLFVGGLSGLIRT